MSSKADSALADITSQLSSLDNLEPPHKIMKLDKESSEDQLPTNSIQILKIVDIVGNPSIALNSNSNDPVIIEELEQSTFFYYFIALKTQKCLFTCIQKLYYLQLLLRMLYIVFYNRPTKEELCWLLGTLTTSLRIKANPNCLTDLVYVTS